MNDLIKKTKDYLSKYKVDDVINKNSKILFILESPHTQEMKFGYPVAGSSGFEMTRFIYGADHKDSFGKVVSQIEDYEQSYRGLTRFSLLNVSSAPMQGDGLKGYNLSNADKEVIAILEKLRVNYGARNHKKKEWNEVKSILISDFKERLVKTTERVASLEYIVPCGKFAKSYLDIVKEELIESIKVVEGIPHPSFNQWRHYDSMGNLRKVIDSI
ncbi:hypothetical protein [Halonatronum saccharophilum]|uniref:hypothetical protein n=1 Tax=Halonatronum saccharophilum TaxID=150060 RepID=UPI00047F4111|nr:hypothetical protein [Halonatronum saccharophilum]